MKNVITFRNRTDNNILLVDDDKLIREYLQEYLINNLPDCSIETASDGVEALEKVAKRVPSLLITNVNMPRMNGIVLLKTLYERGISIPTLVISGGWKQEDFEKELADQGVPNKMIFFLPKPFALEQMMLLLEKLRQC